MQKKDNDMEYRLTGHFYCFPLFEKEDFQHIPESLSGYLLSSFKTGQWLNDSLPEYFFSSGETEKSNGN